MNETAKKMVFRVVVISLAIGGVGVGSDAAKRDLDTKPTKNVARAMIRMVNDINKNTFNGKDVVTCYTCHRGNTNPVVVLPYNGEPAHSTAAVRATMPTVDQLLD